MKLLVGIDGGGTSCRAAVADASGRVLGRGRGGASNIMTNLDGALDSILQAAREALLQAGLDPSVLGEARAVLGLAGANVGTYGQELQARLPFRESGIESDAAIALHGALGDHDGAIAIVGTGTAYMHKRGVETRAIGGWGFAVGDGGGGAWLGWRLLEETLLAFDGIRPSSPLALLALERFEGSPQALVEWASRAKPRDYGSLVPLILEHGDDPLARELLDEAASMVSASVRALHLRPGERLSLLGGLAIETARRLASDIQPFVHPPLGDALDGALILARRYWAASP